MYVNKCCASKYFGGDFLGDNLDVGKNGEEFLTQGLKVEDTGWYSFYEIGSS